MRFKSLDIKGVLSHDTTRFRFVNRFGILDLRFWINPSDFSLGLADCRLTILDLFRRLGAGHELELANPKSKIQNLKLLVKPSVLVQQDRCCST